MGKLQTVVTLPKRILLQGWANSYRNVNINGEYIFIGDTGSFKNAYINPSIIVEDGFPIPGGLGESNPVIFFNTFLFNVNNRNKWVFFSNDLSWINNSTDVNKLPLTNWQINGALGQAGTITILENISEKNSKISIKAQNLTVSGGSILPPGINPNGVYLLQNSLINGKPWYVRSSNDGIIRITISNQGVWGMQYLLNNWLTLINSTNAAANPWEATWPSNIQVSLGSGGKLNLKKKYLYKATGTGLTPNINGLRFYDSGLVQEGQSIYYDETNTYKIFYSSNAWSISPIIGTGIFFRNNPNIVGTYVAVLAPFNGVVNISPI